MALSRIEVIVKICSTLPLIPWVILEGFFPGGSLMLKALMVLLYNWTALRKWLPLLSMELLPQVILHTIAIHLVMVRVV